MNSRLPANECMTSMVICIKIPKSLVYVWTVEAGRGGLMCATDPSRDRNVQMKAVLCSRVRLPLSATLRTHSFALAGCVVLGLLAPASVATTT